MAGEREKERASLAGRGFKPDAPAKRFDDFFYKRQADSAASLLVFWGKRLKKLKNFFMVFYFDANAIIGHFGLGFYSSFMVSEEVEIVTKSYQDNAKAVRWVCDGSPEYVLEETEKEHVGTDIIMHINAESVEFLEENRISELLNKYCKFLAIPVVFGRKKEWKDGKYIDSHIDLLWHNCKLFHGVMESIPISEILKGIDKTETSSSDGWWETSTGAEFGKGRLEAVIRAINEAGFKAH